MSRNRANEMLLPQRATGMARWQQLDNARKGFLRRIEGYASVTIPKLFLPENQDQNSSSIQHDWTSVGAQAVNHLANKIILALFRPGAPFFRLDLSDKYAKEAEAAGVSADQVRDVLVTGEQKALKVLDQKAVRPRLNEAVRHLIVTGNVLLDLSEDENIMTYGLRDYTVKRTARGKVIEILLYQRVLRDELEDDVQRALPNRGKHAEDLVDYVRQYRLRDGKWTLRQYIGNIDLGDEFSAETSEKDFKLFPLTWDLAMGHDYGTGLVEDYAGDFGTLSSLSEAEIKLALMVSDYRWLADPSGVTDVAEFKRTRTGDVIQGREKDVSIVNAAQTGQSLQYVSASVGAVIRRIGQAFLLGSAVTRDAERVTAEEVRMQANELETSLGGVYSRLAVDMQIPLADWLLRQIDIKIQGTQFELSVITGLDALSRNAEAQQLAMFLGDLAQVATMPPAVLARLQLSPVISTLAASRGVDPKKYVKSEEQVAQEQQAAQAQAVEGEAQVAVAQEGAKALAQGNTDE